MVKKSISIFFITEGFVLLSLFYSKVAYANIQVAFLSSLFIILGSSYAYKKMVIDQLESQNYEQKRDLLDEIEDPHELYDGKEINDAPAEALDLKAIVKEEKAKVKVFSFNNMKHGAKGSFSLFRIIPYLFLVLGFIALKNNDLLSLGFYLPALLLGIVIGSLCSKELSAE